MIGIDRKVSRIILKFSERSYSAKMTYDPSQGTLFLMSDQFKALRSIRIPMPADEVSASISRLLNKGWLEKKGAYWGGILFSITALMKHRFAFAIDTFSKKFWGGFIAGLATGIAANLLTGYVQSAIAAVSQWLQNLL